jgi:hypothetical protein
LIAVLTFFDPFSSRNLVLGSASVSARPPTTFDFLGDLPEGKPFLINSNPAEPEAKRRKLDPVALTSVPVAGDEKWSKLRLR